VRNAVNPRACCRYSAFKKRKPAKEAKAHRARTVALLKGMLRKKRRSTRGSRRLGSYQRKPANAIPEVTNKLRISAEVQPARGASITAEVNEEKQTNTRS
jgi:hypothetical protein